LAGSSSADEIIVLSVRKTRRDLQVSLGMLLAGLALWAVSFSGSVPSPGGALSPTTWSGFSLLRNVGSLFVLVGAIFSVINWVFLRRRRAVRPSLMVGPR